MDPNAQLANIKADFDALNDFDVINDIDLLRDHEESFVAGVEDLFDWLAKGGFAPDWKVWK